MDALERPRHRRVRVRRLPRPRRVHRLEHDPVGGGGPRGGLVHYAYYKNGYPLLPVYSPIEDVHLQNAATPLPERWRCRRMDAWRWAPVAPSRTRSAG
ncbi:MAG: hypothetical protein IPK07_18265 [Deltaproteobacteria bacterium]|nr:hypothetical protein [Deltaproteobacteria bacterium]